VTGLTAEEGANRVATTKVASCEGDVDITQRKGKIRTLFDVQLVINFEGASWIDRWRGFFFD
jgi:activator of HSP90 ATPase